MRNIRLDLVYDGTRYQGWQRLAGNPNTLQGKLEQTLSRILGEPIEITASGRTDAGVHAKGQVANFHCESDMAAEALLEALRTYLPEDIGVESCRDVSLRFHARLNAKEKTYQYRVWNSDRPCVFERRFVAVMPEQMDVEKMNEAAQVFLGTHDFSAFCANKNFKKSTERCIKSFEVFRDGEEIRFRVTGNGFLHHMVRILVGTLIEVGRGERSVEDLPGLFGAKREEAGFLVPGKGLCLEEVMY